MHKRESRCLATGISRLLDLARKLLAELTGRQNCKPANDLLRGRTLINLFSRNSTRPLTSCSAVIAGGGDVINIKVPFLTRQ